MMIQYCFTQLYALCVLYAKHRCSVVMRKHFPPTSVVKKNRLALKKTFNPVHKWSYGMCGLCKAVHFKSPEFKNNTINANCISGQCRKVREK